MAVRVKVDHPLAGIEDTQQGVPVLSHVDRRVEQREGKGPPVKEKQVRPRRRAVVVAVHPPLDFAGIRKLQGKPVQIAVYVRIDEGMFGRVILGDCG